jgi:hypothetical protein
VFWPKNLNFMHRFKSAILQKLKNCPNGIFKPVHEIQFFLPNDFFWSIMKMESKKLSLHVRQIQNLGQLKYKTEIFSKRTHKISKILFNLCSYESLASLESKIRRCPFLIFIIIKNIVLIIITTHAKALKTNSFLNTSV